MWARVTAGAPRAGAKPTCAEPFIAASAKRRPRLKVGTLPAISPVHPAWQASGASARFGTGAGRAHAGEAEGSDVGGHPAPFFCLPLGRARSAVRGRDERRRPAGSGTGGIRDSHRAPTWNATRIVSQCDATGQSWALACGGGRGKRKRARRLHGNVLRWLSRSWCSRGSCGMDSRGTKRGAGLLRGGAGSMTGGRCRFGARGGGRSS